MRKFIILLFVLLLCFWSKLGFTQPPLIKGPFAYGDVYIQGVLSLKGDTISTASKKPWQLLLPDIAVIDDSILVVWSVALQRYVTPRVASAASVGWADIIGSNPLVNPYLNTLFNAKQNALPSGSSTFYIGGDHSLHNLDSLLNAHGWVNRTDTIFTNVQNGSLDSLYFGNGLYKIGNTAYVHYEWPIFNANRIQSFYVEANAGRNGYFLGLDSLAGVIRWMRPDSIVGSGGSINVADKVWDLSFTSDTLKVLPYSAKKGSNPGYAYWYDDGAYTGSNNMPSYYNEAYLDGNLNVGFVRWSYSGTEVGGLTSNTSGSNRGGTIKLKDIYTNYFHSIRPQDNLSTHLTAYLPKTGNNQDTLATLYDVRSVSGGSSTRFGVSGEDNSASQSRIFNAHGSYNFRIDSVVYGHIMGYSSGNKVYVFADPDANQGAIQTQNATYLSKVSAFVGGASLYGSNLEQTVSNEVKVFKDSVVFHPYGQDNLILKLNNLPFKSSLDATDSIAIVDVNGKTWKVASATLGGGGSSTRFGYSGEDATAAEDRSFDYSGHYFRMIDNSGTGGTSYWRSRTASWTSDLTFASGGMGVTTNDYPNYDYQAYVGTVNDGSSPGAQISSTGANGNHYIFVYGDKIQLQSTLLKLYFTGLPTYADEAAATTGGLSAGRIYKTSTGELRIKL